MKNTTITETTATVYKVRHNTGEGWADVFLLIEDTSITITINSDYGFFCYDTPNCGKDPLNFLINLRRDYVLKKVLQNKQFKINKEACIAELLVDIDTALENEEIDRDEAQDARNMIDDLSLDDKNLYYYQLHQDNTFLKIYPDCEFIPHPRKESHLCGDFWDDIWLPFISHLKTDLKTNVNDQK